MATAIMVEYAGRASEQEVIGEISILSPELPELRRNSGTHDARTYASKVRERTDESDAGHSVGSCYAALPLGG